MYEAIPRSAGFNEADPESADCAETLDTGNNRLLGGLFGSAWNRPSIIDLYRLCLASPPLPFLSSLIRID